MPLSRLALLLFVACLLVLSPMRAEAADPSRQCRTELKPSPLASERVQWHISPCLGAIESIRLLEAQFELDRDNTPSGAPDWARSKYAAGGLQLVDTWDAKWDPFRDALIDVSVGKVEIESRGEDVNGAPGPLTRKIWPDFATWQASDPR